MSVFTAAATTSGGSGGGSGGGGGGGGDASTYADYVRRIPPNNQYKLGKKVDFEHHGVERDLHEIAKNMKNWDSDIAPPLGLTPVEISDIQESLRKPQRQRSVL